MNYDEESKENFNINDIEIVGLELIKPEPSAAPLNEDTIRHTLEDEFATEINTLKSMSDAEKGDEEEMHFELKIAKDEVIENNVCSATNLSVTACNSDIFQATTVFFSQK